MIWKYIKWIVSLSPVVWSILFSTIIGITIGMLTYFVPLGMIGFGVGLILCSTIHILYENKEQITEYFMGWWNRKPK